MATTTFVCTSNADGSLTIAGSAANSSSGLKIVVQNPTKEAETRPWRQQLGNFIIGTLYP